MRLAVSNIAWSTVDDPEVLATLREAGVTGIEIAPTKVWTDWEGANPAAADKLGRRLAEHGFAVPALQAILFGKPGLTVFGAADRQQALVDHVRHVADLAAALGSHAMVFGAPRNRDRGDLDAEAAFAIAAEVFARIGTECAQRGTALCLEPNPPRYGCNFVTGAEEGRRLVEAVKSPGFRLHLDAAGMHLAGDDGPASISRSAGVLCHFHASEPDLGDFSTPAVDHAALGRALAGSAYSGWVSIEMRQGNAMVPAIRQACVHVGAAYAPFLTKRDLS
jgi:sugar phosphate isomerase/epimerase